MILLDNERGWTEKDLIFMERSVQRKLYEFHDFLQMTGTPTIMARRDGSIVSASKEFSILTGWSKGVLLGREPNLNINSGGASGASTAPGSANRTRNASVERDTGPGQSGNTAMANLPSVLLAEILDQDSVVQFYEDFARLAFGDSRGSVMNTCKLLKYKTKEDMDLVKSDDGRWNSAMTHHVVGKGGIVGEAGMNRLGFKDGRVECSYCWTVKRDVFDIPMLIVMNVSSPSVELYSGTCIDEDSFYRIFDRLDQTYIQSVYTLWHP